MSELPQNGTRREIDGIERVFYDGYWIKRYEPPADSLEAKRRLIHALTRRLFNHVEHGINIPGVRLEEARAAYERETDPERKRVNGAMLAGALFNRASDIFTKLVELQALGVGMSPEDALMQECGQHLLEALELGRLVRHRGGDEGIDELWGEPLKVFSLPVEEFYESRFIKIAQTMRDIDRIAAAMIEALGCCEMFPRIETQIEALADAAKRKCEILRTDPAVFEVWPAFVVAGERLAHFQPAVPPAATRSQERFAKKGQRLIRDGITLVGYITRARVPMAKSTGEYLDRCERYATAQRSAPVEPSELVNR
jgi:hypothetical protein